MPLKAGPIAGNRMQREWDSATHETTFVHAPLWWKEDFLGGSASGYLTIEDTAGASSSTVGDVAIGQRRFDLTTTNEAQASGVTWGGAQGLDLGQYLGFECRMSVTSSDLTGIDVVAGLIGGYPASGVVANILAGVWFSLSGDFALEMEADDDGAVGRDNDNATGQTLTTATQYIFRIDCYNTSDVKFYLDGVNVNNGTTINVAAAASDSTDKWVQPAVFISKASGATEGNIDLDYIAAWGMRA